MNEKKSLTTEETFALAIENHKKNNFHLFTKHIIDNLEQIKHDVPYLRDVTKEGLYKSTLSDILPMHPAVFERNKHLDK